MSIQLNEISSDEVHALTEQFETASLEDVLGWAWERFGARAAIGTSFQGSGLVIMHRAYQAGYRFPVFTLDTGFLFPETLELKARLEDLLDTEIEGVTPDQTPEEQAIEHGDRLWERSPDLCCTLRKVFPLQKRLGDRDLAVWITGVRRGQSETRTKTSILELYEFDALRERYILKLNPMANWSREDVWNYIHEHKIPYNPLNDRGYRSIGCTHCTRATGEHEGERAGRWEGFNKTECGIHTFLGSNI